MTAFAGKTLQFGVVPTETKKSMTGLDLLTGIKNGTLPAPPIQQVLDFRISRLKRGHTVFAGVPKYEFYNPLGSVHGGYIAALLDSCMACAVHSTLEVGYNYATIEVKINYVRQFIYATGEVHVEGQGIIIGMQNTNSAVRYIVCI